MTEQDGGASTCRCCDEQAVAKVLYTYAERIDAGDFAGVAEVLAHATMTFEGFPDTVSGAPAVQATYERTIQELRVPTNGA